MKDSKTFLKILTFYHKKSPLLKDDIYFPIFVGKDIAKEKSKDGIISNEEFNWLNKNLVGDNSGENISKLNRKYCELSGIYWAWKNYKKLGNPQYIEFQHYRRILIPNKNRLTKYKFPKNFQERTYLNEKRMIKDLEGVKILYPIPFAFSKKIILWKFPAKLNLLYKKIMKEISKNFPDYSETFQDYLKGNKVINGNMFIMEKEIFFKYCEFIFKILTNLDKTFTEEQNRPRLLAYVAESLTDLFIFHKIKKGIKTKQIGVISYVDKPKSLSRQVYDFFSFSHKFRNIFNNNLHVIRNIFITN